MIELIDVVEKNIPKGFEKMMNYGIILIQENQKGVALLLKTKQKEKADVEMIGFQINIIA